VLHGGVPALRQRALHCWLPAAIVVGYSLWAFFPQREGMVGYGDDPAFNAWHFLHLFRTFDRHGPWSVFTRAPWNAPIFAPGELRLALSENQLWPALILWPFFRLTGRLVETLDAGMIALHLAAFAAAAGWLGARGIRELRFWGGLLFALCGWLQVQYAHWQNGSIFLLPLALWSWERFRARPQAGPMLICALAFGWISGWNLYFSVMAGTALAGLALYAAFRHQVPPWRLLALILLSVLVQVPVLLRYAQLASQVGGYFPWDWYPATWTSWLMRSTRPSWLEAHFNFWPRAREAGIEANGFLGFAWAGLALASVAQRRARLPLLWAVLAYWASLGPGHGLYDALALLPGWDGLRATGRLQLAVAVATLPAIFAMLEERSGWRRAVPLALVLLELWPAGPALRAQIPQTIDGPPTPLERALAAGPGLVLPLPEVTSRAQLAVLRSGAPLMGGYSGRAPLEHDLVYDLAVRKRRSLELLLDLTSARSVLALDGFRIEEARRSPRVRERGCYDALGDFVCLFDVLQPPPPGPRVALGRDTALHSALWPGGLVVEIVARRAGLLDFSSLARCRLLRVLKFPLLPAFEHDLLIEGRGFVHIAYAEGEVVYHKEIRGDWARWHRWLRLQVSARLQCAEPEESGAMVPRGVR